MAAPLAQQGHRVCPRRAPTAVSRIREGFPIRPGLVGSPGTIRRVLRQGDRRFRAARRARDRHPHRVLRQGRR